MKIQISHPPCSLQTKELLDVVRLDNCHRCRAEPSEATIYSLRGTGSELERFEANFRADLTLEVEDPSRVEHNAEAAKTPTRVQSSKLEMTLGFTQKDLDRVRVQVGVHVCCAFFYFVARHSTSCHLGTQRSTFTQSRYS